jgi:hypothetical protein
MNSHVVAAQRLIISRNPENVVAGSSTPSGVSKAGQTKSVGTKRKATFKAKETPIQTRQMPETETSEPT